MFLNSWKPAVGEQSKEVLTLVLTILPVSMHAGTDRAPIPI